jgi:hypothetical protein
LSIVEGTPTTAKPSRASELEPLCEPLPPITTSASMPWLPRLRSAIPRPAGPANSGERALPRTVPPCWTMPPTSRAASGVIASPIRPA